MGLDRTRIPSYVHVCSDLDRAGWRKNSGRNFVFSINERFSLILDSATNCVTVCAAISPLGKDTHMVAGWLAGSIIEESEMFMYPLLSFPSSR